MCIICPMKTICMTYTDLISPLRQILPLLAIPHLVIAYVFSFEGLGSPVARHCPDRIQTASAQNTKTRRQQKHAPGTTHSMTRIAKDSTSIISYKQWSRNKQRQLTCKRRRTRRKKGQPRAQTNATAGGSCCWGPLSPAGRLCCTGPILSLGRVNSRE